jgi:aminopeptidase N
MQIRRLIAAALVPLAATGFATSALADSAGAGAKAAGSAAAPHFHPGAPGGGDPYFPYQGNGGYNVKHYDITGQYYMRSRRLVANESVTAVATANLSRFNLDLRRSLHVEQVVVGSANARFEQARSHELVITPRSPIRAGQTFDVAIFYRGTPHAVRDPDGSLDGFIRTKDGAFVASEPQGAPTWFAANDTPDDKATYTVAMEVPHGLAAVSNGRLLQRKATPTRTAWIWQIRKPISSYLVTATIGKFRIKRGTTPGGVPYLDAVDPRESSAWQVLRKLPAIVDYFSKVYGRYPLGHAGAIVDHAHRVGYALETATRPLFDRAPSEATLSHELAHQWYGDTVTLHHWRDIWLNEGFAEFSSWLWTEHTGGPSAAKRLRDLLAQPASAKYVWNPPPGNPGNAKSIFSGSVYERGAATLQALREKVGNATFFRIMRGWLRAHRYANARVPQFTAYAARLAHRNLKPFFHNWLYRRGKPRS